MEEKVAEADFGRWSGNPSVRIGYYSSFKGRVQQSNRSLIIVISEISNQVYSARRLLYIMTSKYVKYVIPKITRDIF